MKFKKCLVSSSLLVLWIYAGSGNGAKVASSLSSSESSERSIRERGPGHGHGHGPGHGGLGHGPGHGGGYQGGHHGPHPPPPMNHYNYNHNMGNSMMMYQSIFTISLKLFTVFVIAKLLSMATGGSGGGRHVPIGWSQQVQPAIDVYHNPAASVLPGHQQSIVTQTSTGAAAGAYSGNGGTFVQHAPLSGGYATLAASMPRPIYSAAPAFRFGGPRFPFPRRPLPPPIGAVETHLVETHQHVLVHPDGSQTKMPQAQGQVPAASVQGKNVEAASNVVNVVTEAASASQTETSPATAQRRSSLAFPTSKDQQLYDDWTLHLNPGTRSL